jgi:hypothetical protein
MFRKIASSFVLVVLSSTAPAMATDPLTANAWITAGRSAEATDPVPALLVEPTKTPARGALLPSLYVSLAGLNAYDAYTTTRGVARGAAESNGIMRGAAGSPAAVWVIKGGVTAGSILVSERLWRSGHRAQAIGMMLATNALMATVGARNNNVLRNQR